MLSQIIFLEGVGTCIKIILKQFNCDVIGFSFLPWFHCRGKTSWWVNGVDEWHSNTTTENGPRCWLVSLKLVRDEPAALQAGFN